MKVLMSAYTCYPGGSEPGVGWNWVKYMSRIHDVWVISVEENREHIEAALKEDPMRNVTWIYCDIPRVLRFWKKGLRGVHLHYCLWQIKVYFVAKKLHHKIKFDVTHHVTYCNCWMPSFLGYLNVPFIFGPVGGGETAPAVFFRTFSWRGRIYEVGRTVARWIGENIFFAKAASRRARLVLATTKETKARLEKAECRDVRIMPESALSAEEIETLGRTECRVGKGFRLFSAGRLLHWKGIHLALEAFRDLIERFPDSEYWIAGDGPEKERLRQLADDLGVSGRVAFLGGIDRQACLKKLAECDVFIHPSLHDSGGWATIEAMAAGRPVICLDLGGPAVRVTTRTGIKVPATTPQKTTKDMAAAMIRFAEDCELRKEMGDAGKKRVAEHFNWESKVEKMNMLYREITLQDGK